MARVFVSYASKDRPLAGEVHRWLVEAGHEVFLDQDLRDGLALGEEWQQRLHERLRWANTVVCVVTSAYLDSMWCTAEIGVAQSRGSQLLPLRAEPGVAHPLLASLQHVDYMANPPAARAAVLTALHQIDATWPDNHSPFPGMRPFSPDEHRVFFGRADEVKHLAELLRSPAERAEGAALLVVGPSGCGKSSLVRAGLLPVMAEQPGWRTLPPILPGTDPVAALARALTAMARRISLNWTVDYVHDRFDQRGLAGLAHELLLSDPAGPQQHLLIVMDQFEELLTQTTPTERARLAELLRPALSGPVRVVATLRPEFLNQLLADPDLATLPTRTYILRPLRREALRAVIERPARLAGIDVDDGLVDRLVDDTDSGEALPLLAFTLAQLAAGITRSGRLSSARYDELGGVQGALTRQADAALADAVTTGKRSREQVIAGLLWLVTVDEQGRPTRSRVPRDELPTAVVTELDAFVQRRLLITDESNGSAVIGVAHEAFLSAWPPLAQAVTAAAAALRARRAVEHAANEWNQNGRPPSRLWGGGQLTAAVTDTGARMSAGTASTETAPRLGSLRWVPRRGRGLATDRVDLSSKARDFLYASIRRDRYRRRRTITVLSVLLILALAAAGVAVAQQRRAQEEQRIATARQLAAQAAESVAHDPRTALRLVLAAHHLHPDRESQANLYQTLTATAFSGALPGQSIGTRQTFFPDGAAFVTSSNGHVVIWDIRSIPPVRLADFAAAGTPVLSPDGRTIVTADLVGPGNEARTWLLWDVTDRAHPTQIGSPQPGPYYMGDTPVFSPDGNLLAINGNGGPVVYLWDITDRARPRVRHKVGVNGTSMAFTPDGRTLAIGSGERVDAGEANMVVDLWDIAAPTDPTRLATKTFISGGRVSSLEFSRDGNLLIASGTGPQADTHVSTVLIDVTDKRRPRQLGPPIPGQYSRQVTAALSPTAAVLATSGGPDRAIVLWDISDRADPVLIDTLAGHPSEVGRMTFAPDGRTLVTGDDNSVYLWQLSGRRSPPLTGQAAGDPTAVYAGTMPGLAVSSEGKTLIAGSGDYSVIVWDIEDPAHPRRLATIGKDQSSFRPDSVALSPNGRTVAIGALRTEPGATFGSDQGAVFLWDITDRGRPRLTAQLPEPDMRRLTTLAFTRDGRTLAVGGAGRWVSSGSGGYMSTGGMLDLWNVENASRPARLNIVTNIDTPGIAGEVQSVGFSPDGQLLAASGGYSAMLWDVTERTRPRRIGPLLTGNEGLISTVAFAPDGRTLATGGGANINGSSANGDVILWDITSPEHPSRIGQPLVGQHGPIAAAAFAPDGRTLVTAGGGGMGERYGTMQLWDVTDLPRAHPIGHSFFGHQGPVEAVAFTAAGRMLVGSGYDLGGGASITAVLWDLTPLTELRDHASSHACDFASGGLDEQEWSRYVPNLAYQKTCPS